MVPAIETNARPRQKPLPAPNWDLYQLARTIKVDELSMVKEVRRVVVASLALWGIEG
jgi:hypothetical protein